MPSAQPSPPRDPGLALERTALAWGRSAWSIVAIAGALARIGLQSGPHVAGLVVAGVLLTAALAVWLVGTTRYRALSAGEAPRLCQAAALRLICAVSVFSAVCAAALVLAS